MDWDKAIELFAACWWKWSLFFYKWFSAKVWTGFICRGRLISVISHIDKRFHTENTELSVKMLVLMQDDWYTNLACYNSNFSYAFMHDYFRIFSISTSSIDPVPMTRILTSHKISWNIYYKRTTFIHSIPTLYWNNLCRGRESYLAVMLGVQPLTIAHQCPG